MALVCLSLCAITSSDVIAIISLLITSILGIWIGSTVQKNLTNNRALKEYYIGEVKLINDDYSSFLNCLFKSAITSKDIQEWFKVMNIKIETIQSSIVSELDILPEVLANHITMKQYVTNSNEFNSCYQHKSLILTTSTRDRILEIHRDLKNSFVKIIIDINRARIKK